MAPTSEPTAPTKKSLRIWVKNNGHVKRKKTRVSYTYPRTVEAAQDPFKCSTGVNKMFYLIAINLYPESKIVRPDESESETEVEEVSQTKADCNNVEETNNAKMEIDEDKMNKKRKRTKRSAATTDQPTSTSSSEQSQISHNSSCENYTVTNNNNCQLDPVTRRISSSSSSKNSCQRQRLLPLKKNNLKKNKMRSTANVENKGGELQVCSKVSEECENCLSGSEPVETFSKSNNNNNKVGLKGGTGLINARKLPAIPTIMNSLNKIIETCSASGVVSFSLTSKKKPRDSRS